MESLLALRAALAVKPDNFQLLNGNKGDEVSLKDAKVLLVGGREFDLDEKTAFKSENADLGFIDLRTVVNCLVSQKLSVAEYIQQSEQLKIPNLKFMERNDLLDYLKSHTSSSEYISQTQDVDMDVGESQLKTLGGRSSLIGQSEVLRGSKLVDFSNVVKLSHQYFGPGLKTKSNGSDLRNKNLPLLKPTKGKDPIILLSPSPSSFLNMENVKEFLEDGKFNPVLKNANSPDLVRITRKSNVIGPQVKFVVVDNVDKFKPEYWDRVVAVFVTGQAWQLKSYQWQDPNQLFQNVTGFALVYKNDPIQENLKQWNVKIETVERNVRFRDREVMERIWERIEKYMISRGWPISVN